MATVRLISDRSMNRVVSHLAGVHDAVGDVARRVHRGAERRLQVHRYSGAAKVTLTEGAVDWFVNLEDPAALSIEFGHMVKGKYERDTPKHVAGLYILSRSAGLA